MWLNTVAIYPSIDALDEMKVHTGIYAAEFGRSLGGVVSLQTKSGGNTFMAVPSRSCATIASTPTTGSITAPDGRSPTSASISLAQRWAGRFGKPDLLFRRLPGPAHQAGPDARLYRAERGDAARQLLRAESRVYDPRTRALRGNVIPSVRIDAVARASSTSSIPYQTPRADSPNGQTIDNYVGNPEQRR